jgi:hypothetical protein
MGVYGKMRKPLSRVLMRLVVVVMGMTAIALLAGLTGTFAESSVGAPVGTFAWAGVAMQICVVLTSVGLCLCIATIVRSRVEKRACAYAHNHLWYQFLSDAKKEGGEQ